MKKTNYRPARTRVTLTPGDAVRVTRELQEMSQVELARAADMTQPTLSGIERGKIAVGVERAERLARALKVHPAVLLWPNWDVEAESKRSAG
jgi:transcriptional regulator with XRE-family HTH domain